MCDSSPTVAKAVYVATISIGQELQERIERARRLKLPGVNVSAGAREGIAAMLDRAEAEALRLEAEKRGRK